MKKLIVCIFFICISIFNTASASTELSLNAKSAVLFDRRCKRVLYDKNAYEKVPNASTTKILTAIVVAENCDVNEIVEIGQNAVKVIGSKVKFRKGDKITVNDLMNGMLLCSGNDAAIALAEHTSGTVLEFCKLMNSKAKEIGAMNTNFVTPHGLDENDHYSTAYDLAILADYALNNQYLANIFEKKTETIYINGQPRNISTTNEMLYVYNNADGVKTGFTNNAGRCLVTSATNEKGWQLISVVLGCDTKNLRTQDSKKLLDYGFENFEIVDVAEILPQNVIFNVKKSKDEIYRLKIDYHYYYPLTVEEKGKIYYKQTEMPLFLAPVLPNTEIIKYEIYARRFKNYRTFSENTRKNRKKRSKGLF